MFNEFMIKMIKESKIVKNSIFKVVVSILTILILLYIFLIIFGTIFNVNFINYEKIDKISSILLSSTGIIFILFIISLTVEGNENIVSKSKIEILETINKYKYSNIKKININTDKIDGTYKTIINKSDFKLNVWFGIEDSDDFGRFYIFTTNSDISKKLLKSKTFIEEENWNKNSYAFNEKYEGLENIDNQLEVIFTELSKMELI